MIRRSWPTTGGVPHFSSFVTLSTCLLMRLWKDVGVLSARWGSAPAGRGFSEGLSWAPHTLASVSAGLDPLPDLCGPLASIHPPHLPGDLSPTFLHLSLSLISYVCAPIYTFLTENQYLSPFGHKTLADQTPDGDQWLFLNPHAVHGSPPFFFPCHWTFLVPTLVGTLSRDFCVLLCLCVVFSLVLLYSLKCLFLLLYGFCLL